MNMIERLDELVRKSESSQKIMEDKGPEATDGPSCEIESSACFCSECGKPIVDGFCTNFDAKV